MKIGISEAARRAKIDRKTLYRMLENGKVTKEINVYGKPVIDLSELTRVFPHANHDTGQEKPHDGRSATGDVQHAIAALKALVTTLEADKAELRRDLERERAEARQDIDRERTERERVLTLFEGAQRQLADQRAVTGGRGFLAWFKGER